METYFQEHSQDGTTYTRT